MGYDHHTDIGAYVPIAASVRRGQEDPGVAREGGRPHADRREEHVDGAVPAPLVPLRGGVPRVATDATSETSIATAKACPIPGFDQPETSFSTVGIQ